MKQFRLSSHDNLERETRHRKGKEETSPTRVSSRTSRCGIRRCGVRDATQTFAFSYPQAYEFAPPFLLDPSTPQIPRPHVPPRRRWWHGSTECRPGLSRSGRTWLDCRADWWDRFVSQSSSLMPCFIPRFVAIVQHAIAHCFYLLS